MTSGYLERSWRSRYERWARQHELEHQNAGWSEQGLARRISLVLRALRRAPLTSGSRVLDVGCGPGTYVRTFEGQGYSSVGLDYSWNVTRVANSKDPGGSYVQGEAYHLPFKSGSFDALVCIGVMQSLELAADAIREMQRVLR